MSNGITTTGLASNIDWGSIVDKLSTLDHRRVDLLTAKQKSQQSRLDTLKSLNTKLLSASLDLSPLKNRTTFVKRAATSSNTAALAATASTSAATGTYTISVTSLAQAHEVASAGQGSATTDITGTFSLQVGNGVTHAIDLGGGSSLEDIAAAINKAGIGVNATVVNDGTASPWRLVLKSGTTGTAGTITATGTGDLANLFGVGSQTLSSAQDAVIAIGQGGAGASPLTITRSSNTISDVIPGVTLELKDEANNLTVTVADGSDGAKAAITAFVDNWNTALKFFKENAGYDQAKGAGLLLADSDVRMALDDVTDTLTNVINGLPISMNNLGALGISISKTDGTLTIDEDALAAALAKDAGAVADLFTNTLSSGDTRISLSTVGAKTATDAPFTVNIAAAATQARAAVSSSLAASTLIDGSNNTLSLSINGNAFTVTLAAGTYTREQLASQVQDSINALTGPTSFQSVNATVGDDQSLVLKTNAYGSVRTIAVTGGNAAAALGLTVGSSTSGADVVGTINGTAATGIGQFLTGTAGTAAEGLTLMITGNGPITDTSVSVRKGLAQKTSETMSAITSLTLPDKVGGIKSVIDDLDDRISAGEALVAQRKARYEREFSAMETIISNLQAQGDSLTSFVTSLNKSASSSSGS